MHALGWRHAWVGRGGLFKEGHSKGCLLVLDPYLGQGISNLYPRSPSCKCGRMRPCYDVLPSWGRGSVT